MTGIGDAGMMISDERRFIFVHVEKTAGTSIGQVLSAYANPRPMSRASSLLRVMNLPPGYKQFRFRTHAPLTAAQTRMPADLFNSYYKFAFVRNPWDRLVSEYNAAVKKSRRRRHRRIASFESFEQFILYEIRRGKFFQYPRICDLAGNPALDFTGRFERLGQDFSRVCSELGIVGDLGRSNAFPHGQYREYYNVHRRDDWSSNTGVGRSNTLAMSSSACPAPMRGLRPCSHW
jgi:hypothetical protein